MRTRRVFKQMNESSHKSSESDPRHRYNKRRVALWFVVATFVTFGLSEGRYFNYLHASDRALAVEHSQAVLRRLQAVVQLLDASAYETRDYAATDQNRFLEHDRSLVSAITAELEFLRQLIASGQSRRNARTDLETSVTNRLDTFDELLDRLRHAETDAPLRPSPAQAHEMGWIRHAIAEIQATEERVLVLRQEAADASRWRTLAFFGVWAIVNVLILILVFHSIYREIVRRSAAELELRRSRQRFESIFEVATVGMALVDTNANWLEANRSLCEIFGYSKDELLAGDPRRLNVADIVSRAKDALNGKCVAATYQIEKQMLDRSGTSLWIALSISLIRDDAGAPRHFVIVMENITARKRIEQAIDSEQQRYLALVEASGSIVWNTLPGGAVDSEQPAWSRFTGQSFDQIKGTGWLDAIHPDDLPNTARVWSAAVSSRSTYQDEHRVRRYDGVYRRMLVRAVPIRSGDQTIAEWIGVHTDIDDQTRLQVALRQAKETVESASQVRSEFLACVSHEIRTPMNAILGMTDLTLDSELAVDQRESLEIVKSASPITFVDHQRFARFLQDRSREARSRTVRVRAP